MNKSLSGFGAGLLALGFVMSMSAIVARAGTLEDAMQRLNVHDAQGAYVLLKPEERARAGQPDFDYALGLAAVDTGRGGEAVTAFERVLAVNPDHMQARAELGRAYLAINEPEAARREMATVEGQSDIPPEVRETLNRYVRALDTGLSGGGTHIQSNVTLKAGYDSNVNNSTSDSRILIPAFAGLGFATLGGGAVAQEDMFGEVSGVTTLTHGLSIDRKFIAELSASYRGNAQEEQFNQANAGLNIGLSQNTPDWGTFTVLAQAQSFWVDGKPYRYTLGALGQWTLTTKAKTDYGVYLQYAHQTFPSSSIQNTDRVTLGATIGQYFGGAMQPYVFAGLYTGVEEASHSTAKNLSYEFAGARVGTEVKVLSDISVYATAAVETDNYKAIEPLFLKSRSTVRTDLAAGLRYALSETVKINPEISYTHADSNIPINAYDRIVGSVALSIDF